MLFGLRMMEMGVKWHGWRRVGFLNQGFPEWPFDFASLEEVFQEVEALRTGGRAPWRFCCSMTVYKELPKVAVFPSQSKLPPQDLKAKQAEFQQNYDNALSCITLCGEIIGLEPGWPMLCCVPRLWWVSPSWTCVLRQWPVSLGFGCGANSWQK